VPPVEKGRVSFPMHDFMKCFREVSFGISMCFF